MQKEQLQPIVETMLTAATGAFSTLAGVSAEAGPSEEESLDGSIRVESAIVATLTTLPANGATFVSRFVKADVGRVVEMMLGTPGDGGEMDAMQLSIVAETVAQIATAMGEALASGLGIAGDGINSEVINDAGDFPAPPFTSFRSDVTIGDDLKSVLTIDFDGLSLTKMDAKSGASAAAAAEPEPAFTFEEEPTPPPVAATPPPAAAPAAPASAPPARQRPQPEGQAAQFTPMQPTPIRPAASGQANLDLVHDVPLEISAVLGQTELSLREVVAMQPGSVFELDKLSTEPIDLYVNNILIARGEVVVVDDKFAVKISELNPVVDKV